MSGYTVYYYSAREEQALIPESITAEKISRIDRFIEEAPQTTSQGIGYRQCIRVDPDPVAKYCDMLNDITEPFCERCGVLRAEQPGRAFAVVPDGSAAIGRFKSPMKVRMWEDGREGHPDNHVV
jgi:hypothetical protein